MVKSLALIFRAAKLMPAQLLDDDDTDDEYVFDTAPLGPQRIIEDDSEDDSIMAYVRKSKTEAPAVAVEVKKETKPSISMPLPKRNSSSSSNSTVIDMNQYLGKRQKREASSGSSMWLAGRRSSATSASAPCKVTHAANLLGFLQQDEGELEDNTASVPRRQKPIDPRRSRQRPTDPRRVSVLQRKERVLSDASADSSDEEDRKANLDNELEKALRAASVPPTRVVKQKEKPITAEPKIHVPAIVQSKVRVANAAYPDLDQFHHHILLALYHGTTKYFQERSAEFTYLSSQYDSVADYQERMLPMVLDEAVATFEQADDRAWEEMKVHSTNRISSSARSEIWPRKTPAQTIQSVLTLLHLEKETSIMSGDVLRLRLKDQKKQSHYGIVISSSSVSNGKNSDEATNIVILQHSDPKFALLTDETISEALEKRKKWRLKPIGNISSCARDYQAVKLFSDLELRLQSAVLRPGLRKHRSSELSHKIKAFAPKLYSEIEKKYNVSQIQAIETAVESRNPLTLIQGPPGTGKTHTILGIVGAILSGIPSHNARRKPTPVRIGDSFRADEVSSNRTSSNRILICAPSNAAVNEITRRLFTQGVLSSNGGYINPRVVRIGRPELVDADLKPVFLDQMVRSSTAKGSIKDIRQDIISSAHVICCTLSSAGSLSMCDFAQTFDTVIIDEAAQTVEPSTLIPLKFQPNRVIFVGDHRQLQTVVNCQHLKRASYHRSLFQRMVEMMYPVQFMNEQYRMHPDICFFPSHEFYGGSLLTAPGLEDSRGIIPYHQERQFQPYMFYDIALGLESKVAGSDSYRNLSEVDFIVELLTKLGSKYPLVNFDDGIGIITPYKQQAIELGKAIGEKIRCDMIDKIQIKTVDGFQGREKDIIIVSCVRSNRQTKSIGFLADPRRLNVTITRAKHALWIVGNSHQLETDSTWNRLIQNAKQRKCYMFDDEFYSLT